MNDKRQPCPCSAWFGRSNLPLNELLAGRLGLAGHAPVLLWCEPANGPTRIRGFSGLRTPEGPVAPAPVPLAEARLFYAAGMLHLLAAGDGTRWAAWCEGQPDKPPEWCPAPATPAGRAEHLRTSRPLLLATAEGQRGLSGAAGLGDAVTAVEYYERAVLRWWRLEPNGPR